MGFEAAVWEGMVSGHPCVGTVLEQELGELHITPVRHPGVRQWWMQMASAWTIAKAALVPIRVDGDGQEAGGRQAGSGQQVGRRWAEGRQEAGGRQAGGRQKAGRKQAGSGQGGRQEVGRRQAGGRKQTGSRQGRRQEAGRKQVGQEGLVFDEDEKDLGEELMPVLGIHSFEPNHSGSGT